METTLKRMRNLYHVEEAREAVHHGLLNEENGVRSFCVTSKRCTDDAMNLDLDTTCKVVLGKVQTPRVCKCTCHANVAYPDSGCCLSVLEVFSRGPPLSRYRV